MAHSLAPETVIPIEASLLVLATLLALCRLVPRLVQRQHPTPSDTFLIASILNAVALFITDVMTYSWGGMSEDAPEPSVARAISLKKVQFAGNYFYDTGIYLPKLAILALYFRLFPPTMPCLRKLLYVVSMFTASAMITTCFLDTFWCGRQVSVNWSLDDDACSTFNSKVVFRVDWAMNIITDVLICVLPFPLLHQLQLNRRQIWGLIATFSLGAITIAVSVVRFATIEVIQAWTNVFVLSMAEMAVAIMVVSLPSMRAYIRRGGIFASKRTYGDSSSNHHHRTPVARSEHVKLSSSSRSKHGSRMHPDEEDSGSEVELNMLSRKDVIYETRRISVQFSPVDDQLEHRKSAS
ncbi:archaeal flagellin n-terminal-like domain-containing protein [Stagonosporopsis vannaccii]|nr:archaeal flagellin n-terminal-like domain-containing protein [Stagonosporopsis vannaccii]